MSFRASVAVEGVCYLLPKSGGHNKYYAVDLDGRHHMLPTVPFSVYPGFCCLHMRLSEITGTCFPFIFKNGVLHSYLDIVCLVVSISVERLGRDQLHLFGILQDVSIFISFLSTCQGFLLLFFCICFIVHVCYMH